MIATATVYNLLGLLPVVVFSELLYRLLVQLPLEVFRHHVHASEAAQSVFSLNPPSICIGIVSMLLWTICECDASVWVAMAVIHFVCRFGGVFQSAIMEQLHFIRSDDGLDYGSGLANSYFYGYLRIVLPSTGEVTSKNIRERMEDFEAVQKVSVPIKKLFILVPESMYTPDTFSSDGLVVSKNLETVEMNRAGNAKRPYNNTMYKINTTTWYAAIEGASPLQTVYESMTADPRLKHLRKEIVTSFVKELRKLLWDDLKCRNLCEVVQIDDQRESGEEFNYAIFMKEYFTSKLKGC